MLSNFNPSDDVTDASRVVFLFVDADSADSICELIPNIPDNIDIYALRIGLDVILQISHVFCYNFQCEFELTSSKMIAIFSVS